MEEFLRVSLASFFYLVYSFPFGAFCSCHNVEHGKEENWLFFFFENLLNVKTILWENVLFYSRANLDEKRFKLFA
jgi:hypothetical protein